MLTGKLLNMPLYLVTSPMCQYSTGPFRICNLQILADFYSVIKQLSKDKSIDQYWHG